MSADAAELQLKKAEPISAHTEAAYRPQVKVVWYRSSFFAAIILGLCNFCAPGLWGAMNSVGAGGEETPWLANAANAETFSLMVLTAFLTSTITRYIGVRWTLFFGAAGYAPYAAGLYLNNIAGVEWMLLFGAALCGISAGTFWGIEAAVALSYSEPENQGRFLSTWLTFRVLGPILAGAINLGLNPHATSAGKLNPKVYLVFIALQSIGPFIAFFLPPPEKVQRTDGVPVRLFVDNPLLKELKQTAQLFLSKKFLLVIPFIAAAVFPESYTYTWLALHYSVRARALGGFTGAIVAIIGGHLLGFWLDRANVSLARRARIGFAAVVGHQGFVWVWSTIVQQAYKNDAAGFVYDWTGGNGSAKGWTLYLFLSNGFQINYLYAYFLVGCLAESPADLLRLGGLLRATESAAQAIAYGLNSLDSFTSGPGGNALNFALWGVSIYPAWLVVRDVGTVYLGRGERETQQARDIADGKVSGASSIEEKPEDRA